MASVVSDVLRKRREMDDLEAKARERKLVRTTPDYTNTGTEEYYHHSSIFVLSCVFCTCNLGPFVFILINYSADVMTSE